MTGKNKCKLLKEIRKKIADENQIAYMTSECKFQGECTGTCPKCEAEVRYLEQELEKRKKAGKVVAVAGIAAAMVVTAAGCDFVQKQTVGDVPAIEATQYEILEGSVAHVPETTEDGLLVIGEVPNDAYTEPESLPITETTEEFLLEGDVAWPAP